MSVELLPMLEQSRARVEQTIAIDAPPTAVWDSIMEDMAALVGPDGQSMKFKFEPFPGGRWYRDLGDGVGHFWGHVQVIKPPVVLEITGPLMMSSPVLNHVSYRVKPVGAGSELTITHRLFGDFDPKLPGNVNGGWQQAAERIKAAALKRKH